MGMKTHLQAVESLQQIAPHARLWASNAACLSLRFPNITCASCIESCPQGVLRFGNHGHELAEGCQECGRCAAVCPTGALAAHGFSLPSANASRLIPVECQQVSPDELTPNAVQIPCLGGLKTSQLLAQLDGDGNAVALIDRGWCQDCRSGGDEAHPASGHIRHAQQLLEESGLDGGRIRLVSQPLPLAKRRDHVHEPTLQHQVSRRGFMRHLVGQAATVSQVGAPVPKTLGEPVATDGRTRIVPVERLQIIAALQRLAGKEAALPARLFYQVDIDQQRCDQHQLCAATCPVTALRRIEDEQGVGIGFHPQLCTGCGECQYHCPQQAISLTPLNSPLTSLQPQRLSQHTLQRCFDCGHDFPGGKAAITDQDPVCPSCRKSRELGRALFGGML